MKVILLALPALLLAVPAWVQTALPVPKLGSCPPAYAQSRDYCVPMHDASVAIPKQGQCPSGWASSAHYCTQMPRWW